MLTLSDINALTNSHDGDIYSDLYKDVNGFRPRGLTFVSLEAFEEDFEYLVEQLNIQNQEEAISQENNFKAFVSRIEKIQELVPGTSAEHAIEILADAEDELEDLNFYGYERLEWCFNLKFGSIKQWLEKVNETAS